MQVDFDSRKRNASSPPKHLNNHQLENVQCYKYMELLLSSDLSLSHHIETTCTKAKKLLGLLYHQFYNNTSSQVMAKLYLSFVRPHLEYRAQVWHPHLAKDTSGLEKVQKFGLRICLRNIECKLPGIARHIPVTLIRELEALPTFVYLL